MIIESVHYKDFAGNTRQKTVHFNLTREELTSEIGLQEKFQTIAQNLKGIKRDLTNAEVLEILDMVKHFVRISYGVRVSDDSFVKEDPDTGRRLFNEFKSSAAYDEFVVGLFQDPQKAVKFLTEIMPSELQADIRQSISAETARAGFELIEGEGDAAEPTAAADLKLVEEQDNPWETENKNFVPANEEDTRPRWEREGREPNQKEIREMSPEQLREHFVRKASGPTE